MRLVADHTVGITHAHATQAQGTDLQTLAAQGTLRYFGEFHVVHLVGIGSHVGQVRRLIAQEAAPASARSASCADARRWP